jgi:hypothetical protein
VHFAGGFFGERDGQDTFGPSAAANQFGDTVRDDARLTGPGAGQHEQWAAQRSHGIQLGRVQVGRHRKSVSQVGPASRAGLHVS